MLRFGVQGRWVLGSLFGLQKFDLFELEVALRVDLQQPVPIVELNDITSLALRMLTNLSAGLVELGRCLMESFASLHVASYGKCQRNALVSRSGDHSGSP